MSAHWFRRLKQAKQDDYPGFVENQILAAAVSNLGAGSDTVSCEIGLPRKAPKGGIAIGDMAIPEGKTLLINPAVVRLSKELWGLEARDSNPDRWFSQEITEHRKCFMRFSLGWGSCPGQHLAKDLRLAYAEKEQQCKAYCTLNHYGWPVYATGLSSSTATRIECPAEIVIQHQATSRTQSIMTSTGERENRMNLGLPFRNCSGSPSCKKRDNLLRCGGCQVVLYCGPDHQKAHRPIHKTSCNLIKKAREAFHVERVALETHTGDIDTPPNPFRAVPGQFWYWKGTRLFMQRYHDLMSATLNIRTGEAVEAGLKYGLDMLRLCRGDNQGVRWQVPSLYLRLGRDQEAYDFIKWYGTVGTGSYDWRDMELPFLNLHEEDAFEDFQEHADKMNDLSQLVAMTNLKARLLVDVKGLNDHVAMHPNLSYEERMEWVREEALSDVLYGRREILERDDFQDLVRDLSSQVAKLYRRVEQLNQHYWPALDHPERYGSALPTLYAPGSREEVILVFSYMVTVRVSPRRGIALSAGLHARRFDSEKPPFTSRCKLPTEMQTAQDSGGQETPATQGDSVLYPLLLASLAHRALQ
ncbi:hypothetical protein DL771_007554 [Monosporascus sp. 5C6A]|nr:hypothetical protein DL771_007554 [Monosporascus sp. 5C6A]